MGTALARAVDTICTYTVLEPVCSITNVKLI